MCFFKFISIILILHKVPRKVVRRAQQFTEDWNVGVATSIAPKTVRKLRSQENLRKWVRKWVHDHTTPSSNTRNVVRVKESGILYDHVIHWRTEGITAMFRQCKLEALQKINKSFEKSFFAKCVPSYVRLKRKQDGMTSISPHFFCFTDFWLWNFASCLLQQQNMCHPPSVVFF